MSCFYEMTLSVNSREVDGFGRCKPSALLGHMQEAATMAAQGMNFNRTKLLERYNAFWMLARMWYQIKRPILWAESLTVKTWHRGGRGAIMYRDYDLLIEGERVGEGVSAWVLSDFDSRKLLRLSGIEELKGTDGGELCKKKQLARLCLPQHMEELEVRTMRYSDTDINAHVNNTRYADFICDGLQMQCLDAGLFLKQMQLGYEAESRPGECLSIRKGVLDDTYFVAGVDEHGKTHFDASVIFGEVIH